MNEISKNPEPETTSLKDVPPVIQGKMPDPLHPKCETKETAPITKTDMELADAKAKTATCIKFITDLVNDPFALTPMAKVRAQEFLARI